jgi:hypothetical protein
MKSERSMRLESKGCQNLCVKCHIEETIDREIGVDENHRSLLAREKIRYLDTIKVNGCVSCKEKYPNLYRFIDMDHIDPSNKIDNISCMINNDDITLDQFKEECHKCRPLCRHCHIIHTRNQRLSRII